MLQPRWTTHLLAIRLWCTPAVVRRALWRAGGLHPRADRSAAGGPLHLLSQRRGADNKVLAHSLSASVGLPQWTCIPVPTTLLTTNRLTNLHEMLNYIFVPATNGSGI